MKYEIVLIKNARSKPIIFEKLHTLQAIKTKVKRHRIFEFTTLRRQVLAQDKNIIKYSNSNFKNYFLTFFETFNWVKWSFSRMEVDELKPCSQQK